MLQKFQLKDLFLGNLDAKNELITNSREEREMFVNSFLIPESIFIDDYLKGNKYFIRGMKGTGKTALLRYFAIKAEDDFGANTSFVLFKSELDSNDKNDFSKAANTSLVNKDDVEYKENDYENVWRWFLHRHIVKVINQTDNNCFKKDENWRKYEKCITAASLNDEKSGIINLIPKLKKGTIELEAGSDSLKSKLGLDFEWIDDKKKFVKFNSIVKQADKLFNNLLMDSGRLYIFIDELELTLGKQKDYDKDILLIRDLIMAVNKINNISIKKNYNLRIITGIRSEVVTAVKSSGKEINKVLSDFGTEISWHQKGGNIENHPILRLIEKRIKASEKFHHVYTEGNIWSNYFDQKINGKNPNEYVLEQTWYRPRDVVRLLTIAQQKFPNSVIFSQEVFDATKKIYSTESWIELVEELRTKYTPEEIDGIKRILYGSENPFSFNYISTEANKKAEIYSIVEDVLKKYKIADILSDIYRVGIVGNYGEKIRFSFRGDDEILLEKNIFVHYALRPYLATIRKKSAKIYSKMNLR